MTKILSIFGTRPEAIKMAPVVKELERRRNRIHSIVCVTGQHREMLDQVLRFFGIAPDIDLNLMEQNQSLASLTARAMTALTAVLERIKPDCVLVQGDTTTAMVAALASFYQKIPVGHVEAGLRTLDRYSPYPEEINRRLIGGLAEYHFAPTKNARLALRAEGVGEEAIFVTGNTVIDALHWTVGRPPSEQTRALFVTLGFSLDGRADSARQRIILVTAHRRENFGRPLENICAALRTAVAEHPDVRVVYPVHMNPQVQAPVRRLLAGERHIHLVEPLSYETFAHLLKAATLVLTDSGGIQEEAPALGKPVLVMRAETERPEAIDSGVAKIVGTESANIVREIKKLLCDEDEYRRMARAVSPFGDGGASRQIVQTLLQRFSPKKAARHVANGSAAWVQG
jgi:UDP-N-acetylglucosamine 2-epimerase (non-hydrolysing)